MAAEQHAGDARGGNWTGEAHGHQPFNLFVGGVQRRRTPCIRNGGSPTILPGRWRAQPSRRQRSQSPARMTSNALVPSRVSATWFHLSQPSPDGHFSELQVGALRESSTSAEMGVARAEIEGDDRAVRVYDPPDDPEDFV